MMLRETIWVDTETNGLSPKRHEAVEVSWINMDTGAHDTFIPPHDVSAVLGAADVQALQINRYITRIADKVPPDARRAGTRGTEDDPIWVLRQQLYGNTLAAQNPTFEDWVLRKLFSGPHGYGGSGSIWHHRLFALESFAVGVLKLPPGELPGLAKLCELLDIKHQAPHTARGDVRTEVRCYEQLLRISKSKDLLPVRWTSR